MTCGMKKAISAMKNDPERFASYQEATAELEAFTQSFNSSARHLSTKYTIPVVFHIIHGGGAENITDDQIHEAIVQLNEDYSAQDVDFDDIVEEFADIAADMQFEFALARIDPNGNSTSGIVRHYDPANTVLGNGSGQEGQMKQKYHWPQHKYMNIYVIRSAGAQAGSAWAQLPTQVEGTSAHWDGIVTSHWAVGRTRTATTTHFKILTHEIGHWGNLRHTFNEGCGSDCNTTGDYVCDTPPVESSGSGCNPGRNSCGALVNSQNYMDYGYCTVMFTEGQKTRMHAVFANGTGRRDNLPTEANLIATGVRGEVVSAEFYAEQIMTVPGNAIQFANISKTTNGNLESWEWSFSGGEPSAFTGPVPPPVTYAEPGLYNVQLTVSNEAGESDFELKTDYIHVTNNVYMQTANFTVSDEVKFFDSGFEGSYANRQDFELTYNPDGTDSKIQVFFNSFELENDCASDYLQIYDGPNTEAELIGTFCGSNNPMKITSSHETGALTFVFHSNVSDRFKGWEANVKNVTLDVPNAEFISDTDRICAGESVQFTDFSDGLPDSWAWTFEGGEPATSTLENPLVTYDTPGVYEVSLAASNSLGSDIETKTTFIYVGIGDELPYELGFEGDFPPAGWTIFNQDGGLQWQQRTDAGFRSESCMIMNNADNQQVGTIDEFESTGFDFSNANDFVVLSFDIAYTRFDDDSKDILEILATSDCGENWTQIYRKSHDQLETKIVPTDNSNDWIPSSDSDWRKERIDLTRFSGESFVKVKFRNISGFGTRIWIDNIKVEETHIANVKETISMELFPNPASEFVQVHLPPEEGPFEISVTNLTGKTLHVSSMPPGGGRLDTTLPAGLYTIQIKSRNGNQSQKVLIK